MNPIRWHKPKWLPKLLAMPVPEPSQQATRIQAIQTNIVLPVKLLLMAAIFYYLFIVREADLALSSLRDTGPSPQEVVLESLQHFFIFYMVFSAVAATLVILRRFPHKYVPWVVFTVGLVDGLFLAGLTAETGGFGSNLYWVFPGLIIINALSIPLATPQIVLNLSLCAYFTLDKTLQSADWSDQLSPEQLRYAARDAKVTRDLYAPVRARIEQAHLDTVADIEDRAVPAFVWLACSGAPFNAEAWAALTVEAEERERVLIEQLDAAAPHREGCFGAGAWNWRSNPDVAEAFGVLGFKLDSTGDDVLAGIDHPLAAVLREYRSAAQMVKAFGRSWLDFAEAGRIYAGWSQLGTDAGRSSCKKPNLQQVPKDARYRKCFKAPPGRVLVKADYSQLQLRIACKVAKEKRMLEAYRNGEDLHTLTAKSITGKDEVTKQDRQTAKAVNFGLLFGLGAKGLRSYAKGEYGLELTPADAEQYRRRFFDTYPALARWHKREGRSSAKECRTLLGRRRLLDSKTPYTHRLNSPVQGSEADGAKQAMALLWERRERCPGAFPVLFVHDEIVVEADADKAEEAAGWLKQAMIDGMKDLLAPVPCEVEATSSRTWGGECDEQAGHPG